MSPRYEVVQRVENGRLVWYERDNALDIDKYSQADSLFWQTFWSQTVNDTTYNAAESGELGDFESLFTRFLPKSGLILEAGCGLGDKLLALHRRGYQVEGVDFALDTVTQLRQRYPELHAFHGNILNLPCPVGHYRGYISLGVMEHFPEGPQKVLAEAFRVLEPGGVGIITVPWFNLARRLNQWLGRYGQDPGKLPFYQYAFSRREMTVQLMDAGFEVVHWETYSPRRILYRETPLFSAMLSHPRLRPYLAWRMERVLADHPWLAQKFGHMQAFVVKHP